MADITADVSLVGALEIETDVRGVRGESAYAIAVRNGFVGTEEEWLASLKGDPGTPGQDGHSPVITATKSNGITTVKVDGVTVATINDGEDGHSPVISASKSGKITTITADGTVIATINDGQDGHSPVITTSKSGKTTTILSDGTSIGTVLDGQDGQDGVTPSFSIGTVQDGQTAAASITGTDANPVLNLTLPKGEDGQAGQGIPTGGTQGQVLKKSSATDYDAEWSDESGAVTDVQVNGSSVVTNGVANVPIAGTNRLGVIKTNALGIQMNAQGVIMTKKATSANLKSGADEYNPVVSSNQHESTFYGLARAASDTTQSQSSNAVGNYTEEAKIAIQKMLGIYEAPWELIREDTVTNATEADVEITVDGNGQAFELTDVCAMLWFPQQETEASCGSSLKFSYGTNVVSTYPGAMTQAANSNAKGATVLLTQEHGILKKIYTRWATLGLDNNYVYTNNRLDSSGGNGMIKFTSLLTFTKLTIVSVKGTLNYRILGRRKWN